MTVNLGDTYLVRWSLLNDKQLRAPGSPSPPLKALAYNVALVISDGITARVGSLTANKERFMPWNTIRNEDDRPLLEYQLEKAIRG